ncbi:MAG: HD domain-containing protein [Candidatus Ranarchaeia archaeon]
MYAEKKTSTKILGIIDARNLLLKHNLPEQIIEHSIKVSKIAKNISLSINKFDNSEILLIETAALLHDIGRSISHKIDHGIIGGKILRKMDYPIHARIIEVHMLAGFNKEEAISLGLPNRDFLPITLPEKIVNYSDKRFKGIKPVSIESRWGYWYDRYGKTKLLVDGYKRIKGFEKELKDLGFRN